MVETLQAALSEYVITDPTAKSVEGRFRPKEGPSSSLHYLQILERGLQGNLRSAEGGRFVKGLTPTTPWPLVQLFVQDARIDASRVEGSQIDTVWPRVRIATTLALAPLTLPWRVLRTALRTLFFPCSQAVAYFQGKRYGLEGLCTQDRERICDEWFNLIFTILTPLLPLVEKVAPGALGLLRDRYIKRIDTVAREDQVYGRAEAEYREREESLHASEASAQTAANSLVLGNRP